MSIGIPTSIDELLDQVGGYLDEGYMRIKLKIEPGWDIEPVRAVRETFPDALLQVDANAAYTLADAPTLAGLDSFDLLLIEQPLAEEDLLGHAELAKRITTPICLDESITSARATEAAIELGACSIVNMKAAGSVATSKRCAVHDAVPAPATCPCGAAACSRPASVAPPTWRSPRCLASRCPGDTERVRPLLLARDITPPFVMDDGCLAVPTGPASA